MEGHHLTPKVTTLCRVYNFRGIFIHLNDFISRKFLHQNYSSLSYLSIATWITQFRHLWTKLSSKQENCSNLKNCNSWNFGRWWLGKHGRLVIVSKVDDSWSLDESWQKGRWTTREAPWWLANLLPSSNKSKTPF